MKRFYKPGDSEGEKLLLDVTKQCSEFLFRQMDIVESCNKLINDILPRIDIKEITIKEFNDLISIVNDNNRTCLDGFNSLQVIMDKVPTPFSKDEELLVNYYRNLSDESKKEMFRVISTKVDLGYEVQTDEERKQYLKSVSKDKKSVFEGALYGR